MKFLPILEQILLPRPPGLQTRSSLAIAQSYTFSPLRDCPLLLKLSCHSMEVPLVPQRQCPHNWSHHHILPEAGPSMSALSLKDPPHHQTRDLGGIQEVPSPSAFTPQQMPSVKSSCSCSIKPPRPLYHPFLLPRMRQKALILTAPSPSLLLPLTPTLASQSSVEHEPGSSRPLPLWASATLRIKSQILSSPLKGRA